MLLKQSTAKNLVVFMTDSSDHVTGKIGCTLTIKASKNGAAFGAITPVVTELETGWYALALTTAHTDTLGDFALHITASGADPTDLVRQIVTDLNDDLAVDIASIQLATNASDLTTKAADSETLTTGSSTSGTFADTATDNDVYRITAPVTPAVGGFGLRQQYVFDLALGRIPISIYFRGYWNGSGQTAEIYALNSRTGIYDKLTNSGTNLASRNNEIAYSLTLPRDYADSAGGSFNIVTLEFRSTSTNTAHRLRIDQLLVAHVSEASAVTFSAPSAEQIWNYISRTLTSPGSDPSTPPTAAEIWAAATRTLTAFGFTVDTNANATETAIKASTDNLPSDPADESLVIAATNAIYSRLGAPVGASIAADIAGVQADTDNLQTRVPAALVGGRMDSSVGAMAADVVTAAAIAADAIGAAELAAGAASEIATAVRTELATELARVDVATSTRASQTSVDTIDDFVDTEVAAIKAKTDNLPSDPADASDIAAAFGIVNSTLGTIAAYVDTEVAAIKAKTDNLPSDPADASDVAAAFATVNSALSTLTGYVDTEVAAIKAKTDNLPASPAATSDIPTAAAVADAVWDEAAADHLTAGSTGEALDAASSGGSAPSAADVADAVWDEARAGHASAGTFGEGAASVQGDVAGDVAGSVGSLAAQAKADVNAEADTALADVGLTSAVSARVDVAVSTRLATAGYTAPDNADVAAIKAKTDNLPSDPADASDIVTSFGTVTAAVAAVFARIGAPAGASIAADIADKSGYRLSSAGVDDLLRSALTEGYAADGSAFTVEQALFMLWALFAERGISGTTLTAKKLDGTTAAMTFTLNSPTNPSTQTRST